MLLEKDIEKRRLSLSLYKNTMVNPWIKFAQDHKVGDKFEGTVKNITDIWIIRNNQKYRIGWPMIHYKDLSWSGKRF